MDKETCRLTFFKVKQSAEIGESLRVCRRAFPENPEAKRKGRPAEAPGRPRAAAPRWLLERFMPSGTARASVVPAPRQSDGLLGDQKSEDANMCGRV